MVLQGARIYPDIKRGVCERTSWLHGADPPHRGFWCGWRALAQWAV